MENEEEVMRDRWSSRTVFILASIGSAVGLGNVWRFPYLVASYGGGTFLIPYSICLVAFGMPILLLELASGQKFQGGDVEAFGAMNPRLRGIGLMSVFNAFTIITYYSVIIAWSFCFAMQSFGKLPWRDIASADSFFYDEVIQFRDLNGDEDTESRTDVGTDWDGSWRALMALQVTWIAIYLCVYKGVRSAGEVVKFTMPFPILVLFIIMIAACTLDGAGDGLDQYLGNWDMAVLGETDIWSAATGQVFFTLGVTMGIMTAYSSFNPENQNIVIDEKFISLGDYAIAFMAGFTIYAALGNANKECKDGNQDIIVGIIDAETGEYDCADIYQTKSMGLAFVYMAYITSTIPGEAFWSFIWFITLFTLGIDSAFSMIEAVTTVVGDTQMAQRMGWRKEVITANCCAVAFFLAALFTFDTGLNWLDIVDFYVNSYGLLFTGVLECYAVGWVYKIEVQIEKAGGTAVAVYNIVSLLALTVGLCTAFMWPQPNRVDDKLRYTDNPSPQNVALVASFVGMAIWLVGIVASILVANPALSMFEKFRYIIGWEGCDELRKIVNQHAYPGWEPYGSTDEWNALTSSKTMPIYWCFFIKYLAPICLSVMFCDVMRNNYFKNYNNYSDEQLKVGCSIFWFSVVLAIIPALTPIMFMSTTEAREFSGWDLTRALGMEPTTWTWLGFGVEDEKQTEQTLSEETGGGTAEMAEVSPE